MNISLSFIRILFLVLCIWFSIAYAASFSLEHLNAMTVSLGVMAGLMFSLLLMSIEVFCSRFNLRVFNTAILGLLLGYLMGQALLLIFTGILDLSAMNLSQQSIALVRMSIFLPAIYLGMMMTARAAEELHISIPFIKLKPTSDKKKDILLDASILSDSRIIDLAASGLLDQHLMLPRFVLKELQAQVESGDESVKLKARRCLDVVKKMESLSTLGLRYVDTDFLEIKDPMSKLIRLARLLDANIMTADINRVQQSSVEGVHVINIHILSNALKPLTQSGEYLQIKVQRYGKEARQGVGYLEDGTMVVVNGGAEFIGELIKAQVLSVKHTSSGRMIFCNALGDGLFSEHEVLMGGSTEQEMAHKSYCTI